MRMFQEYASEGVFKDKLAPIIRDSQFVEVSSSADWWYVERTEDPTIWGDDIPIMVLPWPVTWLEYRMPSKTKYNDNLYQNAFAKCHVGISAYQSVVEDDEAESVLLEDDGLRVAIENKIFPSSTITPDIIQRRNKEIDAVLNDDRQLRWIIFAQLYADFKHSRYQASLLKYIDAQGREMHDLSLAITDLSKMFWMEPTIEEAHEAAKATLHAIQGPIWFAVSLMHCKNVHLEDIPISPKVQAKREKRGIPSVTFKTLVVEPMRQQVRREAIDDPNGEQNHIKRALHIARGHFKDYRNGPGLFGKYQGLYWWDMHVRGNSEAGTVIKDYKVKR